VATGTLDLFRRQIVGIDAVIIRVVNRLLGRDPDTLPEGPANLVTPVELM
jgi:hypothetical protein